MSELYTSVSICFEETPNPNRKHTVLNYHLGHNHGFLGELYVSVSTVVLHIYF